MKKRLIGTLLFGALVVSSSSVFVSCTDYDDDIKSLQEQIDANRKSLGALSDQITAGSLITNVQKNGKDVIITLNNGQTYTVEGGADGKEGVNGINGTNGVDGKDAVVWTIGDDGFWYKDGVKTDYKALGVDGQNGQNGADAIAPTVRINSSTGEWEISYDNGTTWQSTGVKAQGEKGEKGDKGDTGATGAQGEKGDKGDTGATGAKGDKGDKGDTGDKGDKGDKGDTGAAGVTPMLKILDNGNWAVSIDGGVTWTDLGVKAQGEKGEKGDTGAQGEKGDKGDTGATGAQGEKGDKGDTGAKGDKGDTGNYYMPAEDGFFHLYDATGKDLGIAKDADGNDLQWRNQVGLTAVFNAETGKLELYGVADSEGNIDYTKAFTLWNNKVTSIVFEGDIVEGEKVNRAYVDGVPAIRVQKFSYIPQKYNNKDSETEVLVDNGTTATVINPVTYAYYHINPTNASFEQIKDKVKFYVKANGDYYATRAAASADFKVEATPVEFKNGILKVQVAMTGTPATDAKISTAALQIECADGTLVTSDYVTFFSQDMSKLRVASQWNRKRTPAVEYHLRRARAGISNTDYTADDPNTGDAKTGALVKNQKVWQDKMVNDADIEVQLAYDGTVNLLNPHLEAHMLGAACEYYTPEKLEALGLGWNFNIVKNYKKGVNDTPQDQFIKVVDAEKGILATRVYDLELSPEEFYTAAIDRTPIVRCEIIDKKNGNAIVESAYIKIKIVDHVEEAPEPVTIPFTLGTFNWACTGDKTIELGIEQYNKDIYNFLQLSRVKFHTMYPFCDVTTGKTTTNGTVVEKSETGSLGEVTHKLQWTMTPDEIWNHGNGDVTFDVYYGTNDGTGHYNPALPYVKLTLTGTIAGVVKIYKVEASQYINEYWNTEKTQGKVNVQTPWTLTDINNNHCIFTNDLNGYFVQNAAGVLDVAGVSSIKYYFDKLHLDGKTFEFGKVGKVTFAVDAARTTLYAKKGTARPDEVAANKVAYINNGTGLAIGPSITDAQNVLYYGGSENTPANPTEIAKELLNEGPESMWTYIIAEAKVCTDTRDVTINFQNNDHFRLNVLRPMNISPVAGDYFIDALDLGELHSFMRLEDLIDPYDWRNRHFNKEQYKTYWKYYGVTAVNVDLAQVTCDLNGVSGSKVPVTISLDVTYGPYTVGSTTYTSAYGFLTYKNNGAPVISDFNLEVPVTVTYKWGTITTDKIKVPVKNYEGAFATSRRK